MGSWNPASMSLRRGRRVLALCTFALGCGAREDYTRYASYPRYCALPRHLSTQAVPPVNYTSDVDIVQASVVVRHGQRTPWDAVSCWKGYNEHWECDPATRESPYGDLWFEKQYDTRHNHLEGSCQLGQLLASGRDQEAHNGELLREAYVSDVYGGRTLFLSNEMFDNSLIFYRSDDDQRTLLSGQILLQSLFSLSPPQDKVMDLHTADRSVDVLSPNEVLCPHLRTLREEAEQSDTYQAWNSSEEADTLRNILREDLDSGLWEVDDSVLDCLMTTICTDRALPPPVDDYNGKDKSGVFQRMVQFVTKRSTFLFHYNDAAYSKLAMAPLWKEITSQILSLANVVDGTTTTLFPKMQSLHIPRLALYSGHDDTIMPLLASLGNRVWDDDYEWTPYASMFIIEVYMVRDFSVQAQTEPLLFRLLYNGEIITGRMDDCPFDQELCPLSVLLDAVAYSRNDDFESQCAETVRAITTLDSLWDRTYSLLQDPVEQVIVFGVFFFSSALGWFVTYVILMKRIPFKGRRRPLPIQSEIEYGRVE